MYDIVLLIILVVLVIFLKEDGESAKKEV